MKDRGFISRTPKNSPKPSAESNKWKKKGNRRMLLLPGELRVHGKKTQTTNKGKKNMGGGLLDNVHSLSSVFGLDQLLLEHLAL